MDNKSFEETKKKYEDEIRRLDAIAEQTQAIYQRQFEDLKRQEKALLDEFNTKMQNITIGIERLRGAYTALVDIEEGNDPTLVVNGMMKETDVKDSKEQIEEKVDNKNDNAEIKKDVKIDDSIKEKAHEAVKQAKEKGLVTPYKEFAESELGKETSIKDVKEVVTEERLAELNQPGEYILSDKESEALQKVIEETKIKELEKKENSTNENISKVQPVQNVNPEEVPDYLKEQYGME